MIISNGGEKMHIKENFVEIAIVSLNNGR